MSKGQGLVSVGPYQRKHLLSRKSKTCNLRSTEFIKGNADVFKEKSLARINEDMPLDE